MYSVETVNYLVALGTVALEIGAAILLVTFLFPKLVPGSEEIKNFLGRWGILIAFVVASIGSAFTVIHSGIFGLEPCPLCWWQRVFLSQVVLFAFALWRPATYRLAAADFSIAFSVIGGAIAVYHHALQMLPGSGLPCPATGSSCAKIVFLEFGYITYPMMALSLFAFLIVLMLFVRNSRN